MYIELCNKAGSLVCRLYLELIPPPTNTFHYESDDQRANISYDLAMTTKGMMICPSRSEGAMIANQIGPITLEGTTLLVGTLKTEDEWDAL